jgi:hypothetical protein
VPPQAGSKVPEASLREPFLIGQCLSTRPWQSREDIGKAGRGLSEPSPWRVHLNFLRPEGSTSPKPTTFAPVRSISAVAAPIRPARRRLKRS